ncbi:hypothetical protein CRYUN_Cryun20dG0015000 [Craigia yunnanensis]
MEKRKCKLCFKSFANGRALGGHMRSHMLNLPIPPKVEEQVRPELPTNQPSAESEAASASYSSEEKGQFYGLRENPKRSIRLVDPEFVDVGSVVLEHTESETDSSKNPIRRRSKRTRKTLEHHQYHHQQQRQEQAEEEETKKLKVNNSQLSKIESWTEPEPVSSISDTTNKEDVAFCLMMLSRDQWKSKVLQDEEEEIEIEKSMEETDESEEYIKLSKVNRTSRGKYKCETCDKIFKSYQALGGHRASHKKIKAYNSPTTHETDLEPENVSTCSMTKKKIYECPVCFRVFSSGQALGGHKRSHITGQVVATTETPVKSSKKLGDSLIDLNLPAPMDDDDVSQIELSVVSDAEFVNHIK